MNNVRSLVGKAQTLLYKADSQASFEESLLQLSYDDDYQMAEGFYIFTYSFDGPLVSHAKLHHLFGRNLDQIFAALERSEDGAQLHADFVAAAEGAGTVLTFANIGCLHEGEVVVQGQVAAAAAAAAAR